MPKPIEKGMERDELYKLYNSAPGDDTFVPDGIEDLPSEEDEITNEDEMVVLDNEDEPLTEEQLEKLLNTPDELLKKYGIDDTKQWKSYQRALTKSKQEQKLLEKENEEYKNKLNVSDSQFEQLKREIDSLKTPSVNKEETLAPPTPPQIPQMPSDFDWADVSIPGTSSYDYMNTKTKFDMESHNYQIQLANYNNKLIGKVTEELKNEKMTRARTTELESIKTDSLSRFIKAGLSPAEAQECWKKATDEAKTFYTPENVAALFKITKGITPTNSKKKKFNSLKTKRKFGIPPGIGGEGTNTVIHPNEFSKSTGYSKMYETK